LAVFELTRARGYKRFRLSRYLNRCIRPDSYGKSKGEVGGDGDGHGWQSGYWDIYLDGHYIASAIAASNEVKLTRSKFD